MDTDQEKWNRIWLRMSFLEKYVTFLTDNNPGLVHPNDEQKQYLLESAATEVEDDGMTHFFKD
ncbi:MAG: hypothetical protein J7619_23210 [Dyadobacter sp.]|uniref:hypothetical protein n=1 Tax=Dyadobacter sp. TaxID=1914288 RepID=UPI001B28DED7|nr:hypothetical protein [Dyadobacter sp.]MBO9615625.1 hypothetical protein [Dyadobacter sp.]